MTSILNILPCLAVPALLLGVAGCFSLESTSLAADGAGAVGTVQGEAVAHVVASNYGWYFFDRWPIVCGNILPGKEGGFVFFRNTVDEKPMLERFIAHARERDCDVVDLQLFNNAEVLMTIGFGGLSIPLPYVVSFRDMQYSGVLVRRTARTRPADERARLSREMKSLLNRLPGGGAE
ncbi:MAG: hypothetical protein ACI4Q3_07880 [Kiritimatiellia bacterium]